MTETILSTPTPSLAAATSSRVVPLVSLDLTETDFVSSWRFTWNVYSFFFGSIRKDLVTAKLVLLVWKLKFVPS